MELARDPGRDRIIHGYQRHRFARLLAAPQPEGRDVDPVLAKPGTKRADEAWSVGVDDIDHLAGELGLDRNAEDVDQPRRAIAEQGPFDALGTLVGADRDRNQRVVIAFALVADFAHGDSP